MEFQGWNLSFDCATKTLAFSLSRINFDEYRDIQSNTALSAKAKIEAIRYCLYIADADMVDLFPGVKDQDIEEIPRIKALNSYITTRVLPSVAKFVKDEQLTVSVEYQMRQNDKSAIIEIALLTIFANTERLLLIKSAYKNMIKLYPAGDRHNFDKYSNAYDNNKEHTKVNLINYNKIFNCECLADKTNDQLGHIADSFMQIVAYILIGYNMEQLAAKKAAANKERQPQSKKISRVTKITKIKLGDYVLQ